MDYLRAALPLPLPLPLMLSALVTADGRNPQSTARYTALAPDRFKRFLEGLVVRAPGGAVSQG